MGTFNPVTYLTIGCGIAGCLLVSLVVFLLRPKDGGCVLCVGAMWSATAATAVAAFFGGVGEEGSHREWMGGGAWGTDALVPLSCRAAAVAAVAVPARECNLQALGRLHCCLSSHLVLCCRLAPAVAFYALGGLFDHVVVGMSWIALLRHSVACHGVAFAGQIWVPQVRMWARCDSSPRRGLGRALLYWALARSWMRVWDTDCVALAVCLSGTVCLCASAPR
jgi:hypothetical protein